MFVIAVSILEWRVGVVADVEVSLGADPAFFLPVTNINYLMCHHIVSRLYLAKYDIAYSQQIVAENWVEETTVSAVHLRV